MGFNQTIRDLESRFDEAQQAAIALAEGLAAIAEPVPSSERSVRSLVCPLCWAASGRTCTITGPDGDHLARWLEAERRGVITPDQLAAVVGTLEVTAAHVIVRDGAS